MIGAFNRGSDFFFFFLFRITLYRAFYSEKTCLYFWLVFGKHLILSREGEEVVISGRRAERIWIFFIGCNVVPPFSPLPGHFNSCNWKKPRIFLNIQFLYFFQEKEKNKKKVSIWRNVWRCHILKLFFLLKMLPECWNELLFLFSGCFLFVWWVLFATMLGSWVIGRENGCKYGCEWANWEYPNCILPHGGIYFFRDFLTVHLYCITAKLVCKGFLCC